MNRNDNTDLIEAYLENFLSEDERKEVEHRMETDPNFRKEVRLHRHLQSQLGDPENWKHYQAMASARDNLALPLRKKNYIKWLSLLAVILAAGFLVWKQSEPEVVPPAPASPVSPSVSEPAIPVPPAPEEKRVTPPKEKPASPPIAQAQAEPANFVEHETGEANLSGKKGSDWIVTISSPALGADFKRGKKGEAKIFFRGTIEDATEEDSPQLQLRIYNNKDLDNFLLSQKLETRQDTDGAVVFEHLLTLDWQPGLYYFKVVDTDERKELKWGKFTIGKP